MWMALALAVCYKIANLVLAIGHVDGISFSYLLQDC